MFNINYQALCKFIKEWFSYIFSIFILTIKSHYNLRMKILALESQLSLYEHHFETNNLPRPQSSPAFRQLWVLLSKYYSGWMDQLKTFQPSTVLKWHRNAFSLHWAKKSKRTGRPRISKEVIQLIRKVHEENEVISPEKIHEQLKLHGVVNAPAPNTIAKYLPSTRKPPTEKQKQSWKTFIKNHLDVTWAADFFTIPTLNFKILNVLIIVHHKTRRIVHFNVTTNPNAEWVVQQFRNATPYGKVPKYLIHDNDPLFRAKKFQRFLQTAGIQSKRTAYKSPWQNAYAERVIGTIQRECTDHFIPLSVRHTYGLLHDYIQNYYNTNRTHKGLNGQTPIPTPTHLPVKAEDVKLKATPVMKGLYHTYKRIA